MLEIHDNLSSKSMAEKDFVRLLGKLNYTQEQIDQLLIKFRNGEVLEAQDQLLTSNENAKEEN